MNETDTLMSKVSKVLNTVLYYGQINKWYVFQRCQKYLKITKGCTNQDWSKLWVFYSKTSKLLQ